MISYYVLNKKYCNGSITDIENFLEAVNDTTTMWVVHHRLETHNSDGVKRLINISKKELMALGNYWNVPVDDLIFLRYNEHCKLHKERSI